MLHIVLDTTIFRSDVQRRAAEWSVLKALAEKGMIQIYVTDVTRREFSTYLVEEFDVRLASIRKAVRELEQLLSGPSMDQLKGPIIAALKNDRGTPSAAFEHWRNDSRCKILPVDDSHGKKVLDAYFSGTAPFAGVKKTRDDFPDAFIYQAILDLVGVVGSVVVVTDDGNLSKRLAELQNVTPFPDLRKMVHATQLDRKLRRTENLAQFMRSLVTNREIYQKLAEQIEERLSGENVSGFSDECEAVIDLYGEVEDLHLEVDKLEDYGEGIVSIPFEASSECTIGYFMDKSEWYMRDEEENGAPWAEDWNDHVVRVEETLMVQLRGTVSFELGQGAVDGVLSEADTSSVLAALAFNVQLDELEAETEAWGDFE